MLRCGMLTKPCNAVPEELLGEGGEVNALSSLLRQASIEKKRLLQLGDVMGPSTSGKKVRERPASADQDLAQSPTKVIRTLVSYPELV